MKTLRELFKEYDENNKKTLRETFSEMDKVGRSTREIFEDMDKKGRSVKEIFEDMTEKEKLELLASDGMLLKRPILVNRTFALIGFKEDEYREKLL